MRIINAFPKYLPANHRHWDVSPNGAFLNIIFNGFAGPLSQEKLALLSAHDNDLFLTDTFVTV